MARTLPLPSVAMAAVDVVDAYVSALPGDNPAASRMASGASRCPPSRLPGGRRDRRARGRRPLRVQAFALAASEQLNPWNFLHWNRQTRLTRFACTSSGDIWVQGELPVARASTKGA